ncbi:MAG TPA: D-alanine--D-alanine ligase [Lacibacter sp.]|nr:D-alanine--D-alanine ligase [Lacibacter sp.]HMO87531.1 D-alanine--D-alanine ligase [Lacibacter sp.]HMP87072.1 D-alanine--D-alanine ligase [Lacibacter sp.]
MSTKKRIALVTGGYSGEAVVSYKSAKTIAAHLDATRYDVFLIDIRSDGWWYVNPSGVEQPVNRSDFSITTGTDTVTFDAVFIGLHGTPGEDGKLQGYFDMLGIPYTSCNAATSAITFNKRYTVAVAAFAGIAVARSVHLLRHLPWDMGTVTAGLNFPVFVKPNNGGSSIGMSKVDEPGGLAAAIEKAFAEDDQVLIEEMIRGREFTIGVFEHRGEVIALPMTEVRAHADKDFFDFEAKYQGKSDEVTPAVASVEEYARVNEAARRIYRIFNCSGVIRIDFIYEESSQQPFMLEINTVPGQSDASIVPQQVRAYGWTLDQFYSALLDEAMAKKQEEI